MCEFVEDARYASIIIELALKYQGRNSIALYAYWHTSYPTHTVKIHQRD